MSIKQIITIQPKIYFTKPQLIYKLLTIKQIIMKAKKSKKGVVSQDSDREEDNKSQKSDNSNEEAVDTDNSPKVIPVAKLPEKLKTKKIVINISDTQYPIIQEIAEQLGWTIEREEGIGDWDLWWTDREITPDTLFKMNLHQKINHFPGIYVLARKNMLGLNLMAMRDQFEVQYNFFPQTWVIPLQFAKFRAFYQSIQKGKTRTYIVKPEALSQGRGIFLTRNIQNIMNGRKYVVQRYLKNPLLIDDLKFDLRIYVLLAGTNPLRLYLYQQGLARFATRKYEQPNDQNLNQAYIHLTNYSLNKKNPQYMYNTSQQEMNVGHKRTLTSTYQYLAKKGYDVKKLKQQIQDVIIKTVIAGLPAISHQYQYCQPEEYENNMCFHILGVDIMIDSELKPYLIQINHTPSFQTGTPLDYKVKKNLIIDTLKIMRITSKNKRLLFQKSKQLIKKRVQTGKRQIVRGQRREELLAQAQKKRDKQQAGLLGGFKKIFPLENNEQMMAQYSKMIDHAQQVHKDTEETRRKLIRDEQQKMKNEIKNKNKQSKDSKDKTKPNTHNPQKQKKIKQIRQIRQTRNTIQRQITIVEGLSQTYHLKEQIVSRNGRDMESIQRQVIDDMFQSSPNVNHILPNYSQKQVERTLNTHSQSHSSQTNTNIVSGGTNRNCNFRTKMKKNVYNPNEFMLNYIASKNVKKDASCVPNQIETDQETFYNIKKAADKKRKEVVCPQKQKNKEGAYIIPKMYQIVDSKAPVRIEIQTLKKANRDKHSGSPQITQSQKLKPINSYKGMYKQKRFSLL